MFLLYILHPSGLPVQRIFSVGNQSLLHVDYPAISLEVS